MAKRKAASKAGKELTAFAKNDGKRGNVAAMLKLRLNEAIIRNNKREREGYQSFNLSPSKFGGCARKTWYSVLQYQAPREYVAKYQVVADIGTSTHTILQQKGFKEMQSTPSDEFRLLTSAEVEALLPEGVTIKNAKEYDDGYDDEFHLHDKRWGAYRFSLKIDGIASFMGEYYLLEIKTMNDRKYKENTVNGAHPHEYKIQYGCYSIVTGIPRVLFIYVNRNDGDIEVEGFLSKKTADTSEYDVGVDLLDLDSEPMVAEAINKLGVEKFPDIDFVIHQVLKPSEADPDQMEEIDCITLPVLDMVKLKTKLMQKYLHHKKLPPPTAGWLCKFCEYKALCDLNYTVPDTEYTTDKKTGLPKVKSSTDNKEEDKTSE